jgi:hypothetical protein
LVVAVLEQQQGELPKWEFGAAWEFAPEFAPEVEFEAQRGFAGVLGAELGAKREFAPEFDREFAVELEFAVEFGRVQPHHPLHRMHHPQPLRES